MLSRGIDRLMDAATRSLAEEDAWLDVIQASSPACPAARPGTGRQQAGRQACVCTTRQPDNGRRCHRDELSIAPLRCPPPNEAQNEHRHPSGDSLAGPYQAAEAVVVPAVEPLSPLPSQHPTQCCLCRCWSRPGPWSRARDPAATCEAAPGCSCLLLPAAGRFVLPASAIYSAGASNRARLAAGRDSWLPARCGRTACTPTNQHATISSCTTPLVLPRPCACLARGGPCVSTPCPTTPLLACVALQPQVQLCQEARHPAAAAGPLLQCGVATQGALVALAAGLATGAARCSPHCDRAEVAWRAPCLRSCSLRTFCACGQPWRLVSAANPCNPCRSWASCPSTRQPHAMCNLQLRVPSSFTHTHPPYSHTTNSHPHHHHHRHTKQDQSIKLKEEYHHFRNRSGGFAPPSVAGGAVCKAVQRKLLLNAAPRSKDPC